MGDEPFSLLDGKDILVTGGTGSFGRAFVRSVLARYSPNRVIIYSRGEFKQAEFAEELSQKYKNVRFFIGDVRDERRLEMAMRGVNFVVHAAAIKHVSIAEYNPFECVKTNIIGTENVCRAAIQARVSRVVALSTDKAASPINLYGASKLAADKICIAANSMSGDIRTSFAVVRYGNVVASSGSVVPLFRRLIKAGSKTLPVTDPRMTRFWITLDKGVDFVLSSLEMMRGGEIFVPKIPSMKIVDLAEVIAPGIPHEFVGLRPGEKLHEVMITTDDAPCTVEFPDRYVIEPQFPMWPYQSHLAQGIRRVKEAFHYSSDSNPEWLSDAEMVSMINGEF